MPRKKTTSREKSTSGGCPCCPSDVQKAGQPAAWITAATVNGAPSRKAPTDLRMRALGGSLGDGEGEGDAEGEGEGPADADGAGVAEHAPKRAMVAAKKLRRTLL
jgi:hypothetical protein